MWPRQEDKQEPGVGIGRKQQEPGQRVPADCASQHPSPGPSHNSEGPSSGEVGFCSPLCPAPPILCQLGVLKLLLRCLPSTSGSDSSPREICTKDMMKAASEDLAALGPGWGQLASGPADRGGVAILSLPSIRGDGSSDCPTLPLPEHSRSLRCRGEERRDHRNSPLLPDGADPTPRGPAATVSGQGAQECLSSRVLHTVGTQSICRGHAKVCSWAWREPCPAGVTFLALSPWWPHCSNSSRFGMSLFTINVNLTQRTSSSERPAGVCQAERVGGGGGKQWEQATRGALPAPFMSRYVGDPFPGTWPLWALESSNQVGVRSPQLSAWAPALSPHPFI